MQSVMPPYSQQLTFRNLDPRGELSQLTGQPLDRHCYPALWEARGRRR